MPLMVSTGEDEVVESGPIAELVERPNPEHSRRAFWLATNALLDLFGKVHWFIDEAPGGGVRSVIPINPLQMRAVLDRRTGEVRHWKFRPAGQVGNEQTLSVDEVYTILDPDFEAPHNPLEGLSPRRAVAMAIAQYYKADLANEASLHNGVEPSGALVTENNNLSEQQRRDIKQELSEHHSGVRNRRRFMLLEAMKWERIGADFKDMEFSELKKMSRTDICAAFGVPPAVIGYFEDSNRAHADAATEQFWTNTILPRASRLAEEWNEAVLKRFNRDRSLGVTLATTRRPERRELVTHGFNQARKAARRSRQRFFAWFDSSGVAAIQRATLAQAQQAKTWFDMGTPLNAIIQATDAPFPEVAWGEVGYLPIGLRRADEDMIDRFDDPDGSDPEAGLLSGDGRRARRRLSDKRTGAGDDAAVKATEQQRAALWAQWRASWEGLEDSARSRCRRHFHELRSEMLANLEAQGDQLRSRSISPDVKRDVIGAVLFDLERADDRILSSVGRLIREGFRLGGSQAMQEAADATGAAEPDPFNMDSQPIIDAMRSGYAPARYQPHAAPPDVGRADGRGQRAVQDEADAGEQIAPGPQMGRVPGFLIRGFGRCGCGDC